MRTPADAINTQIPGDVGEIIKNHIEKEEDPDITGQGIRKML